MVLGGPRRSREGHRIRWEDFDDAIAIIESDGFDANRFITAAFLVFSSRRDLALKFV